MSKIINFLETHFKPLYCTLAVFITIMSSIIVITINYKKISIQKQERQAKKTKKRLNKEPRIVIDLGTIVLVKQRIKMLKVNPRLMRRRSSDTAQLVAFNEATFQKGKMLLSCGNIYETYLITTKRFTIKEKRARMRLFFYDKNDLKPYKSLFCFISSMHL